MIANSKGKTALALAAASITSDKIVEEKKHCGIRLFTQLCELAAKQIMPNDSLPNSELINRFETFKTLNEILNIDHINDDIINHTAAKEYNYNASNGTSGILGFVRIFWWYLTRGQSPEAHAECVSKIYHALFEVQYSQDYPALITKLCASTKTLSSLRLDKVLSKLVENTNNRLAKALQEIGSQYKTDLESYTIQLRQNTTTMADNLQRAQANSAQDRLIAEQARQEMAQQNVVIEQSKAVIQNQGAVIQDQEAVIQDQEAVIQNKDAVIHEMSAEMRRIKEENERLKSRAAASSTQNNADESTTEAEPSFFKTLTNFLPR